MTAPVLAVGDGALGFWKARRDVFTRNARAALLVPQICEYACRAIEIRHPGAVAAMKGIYNAEDIDKAQLAMKAFDIDYGKKYPKAVAKITADLDVLLDPRSPQCD